jgi:NADPH-dependent curcumin reductase CurA
MTHNARYRLAARPDGLPKRSDWLYGEEPVGTPEDGEFLVRVDYVSPDPAMRSAFPDALLSLFAGGNTGKFVLAVS